VYIDRESYRVASIVAEIKILGCPGYTFRWEGLPKEANTTEYAANVKRQGNYRGASWSSSNITFTHKYFFLAHARNTTQIPKRSLIQNLIPAMKHIVQGWCAP
jgi:hypothetical protein